MIRVVVDTNILVSALLFGGKPGQLIPLWKTGKIQPHLSREIMDEYLRVLSCPKFELTESEITYLVYREILPYFEMATVKTRAEIVKADPSDDKFLHCALSAAADCIISGDRHLLSLGSYQDIPILTVEHFFRSRLLESDAR